MSLFKADAGYHGLGRRALASAAAVTLSRGISASAARRVNEKLPTSQRREEVRAVRTAKPGARIPADLCCVPFDLVDAVIANRDVAQRLGRWLERIELRRDEPGRVGSALIEQRDEPGPER